MVAFYKHEIPSWMDGTENLSDRAYRAYHVVLQLIYLNEGPIVLNVSGIAGRCNQHLRTFRAALQELLEKGKLQLNDGKLNNIRAFKELQKIDENRINARKGGQRRAEIAQEAPKLLENNTSVQASLENVSSLKDKTRPDKKDGADAPQLPLLGVVASNPEPRPSQEAPEARVFRRGREILGQKAGGLIKKLIDAKNKNCNLAIAALETAATKSNPAEYIGAIVRNASNSSLTGEPVIWRDNLGV